MRDEEIELVVSWNGVNDGRDGDHLCAGRMSHKVPAPQIAVGRPADVAPTLRAVPKPKRTPAYLVNRNAVIFALHRAAEPLTVLEIAEAAKVAEFTVRNVLRYLESKQLVTWSRRIGAYKRGVTIYRLVASVRVQGAA